MNILILTAIIVLVLVGLAFAGMALRVLLVKGGEFRGTCASNNPYLKNELGECTVCGKPVGTCETETQPS